MATDINKKYLKPGVVDVLLLYLPSDGMYAEVTSHPEIMEKLGALKVSPTSPATLFPLMALIGTYQERAYINEKADFIIQSLQKLRLNIVAFNDEFRKLGDKI